VTVSNNYPVKVMPDLTPKSITVNGKAIKGFHKDIRAYSYLLKAGAKAPVVKAFPLHDNISVEIEQAKGVPGTAVVSFIDYATLEMNRYYINFDVGSVSDEFNNGVIGPQW